MTDDAASDPLLDARIRLIECERKHSEAIQLFNFAAAVASVAVAFVVIFVAIRISDGGSPNKELPVLVAFLLVPSLALFDVGRWSKKLTACRIDVAKRERTEELALRRDHDRAQPRKRCWLLR